MLLFNRTLLELNIGGNLFDDKTISKMKENICLVGLNENELNYSMIYVMMEYILKQNYLILHYEILFLYLN